MSDIHPSLEVNVAGIRMKNPVMTASGTFGYGSEYVDFIDLNQLGAVVVKGITSVPWSGNSMPRIFETPSGMLNAIGLQNVGVDGFIDKKLPYLRNFDVPVIVNICGNRWKSIWKLRRNWTLPMGLRQSNSISPVQISIMAG